MRAVRVVKATPCSMSDVEHPDRVCNPVVVPINQREEDPIGAIEQLPDLYIKGGVLWSNWAPSGQLF
jgi:hypothetical protein